MAKPKLEPGRITSVNLTEATDAKLRAVMVRTGLSRSKIVNQLVAQALPDAADLPEGGIAVRPLSGLAA